LANGAAKLHQGGSVVRRADDFCDSLHLSTTPNENIDLGDSTGCASCRLHSKWSPIGYQSLFVEKINICQQISELFQFLVRRTMFMRKIVFIAVGLASMLSACQEAVPPQPTAKVAGLVTLDGTPLPQGEIVFMPQSAGQARPEPAQIVEGKYEAAHVPQGKVKVMFTATKETGKVIEIPDSTETYPEVVSMIPPQYAVGIDIEVTGDDLNKNFELTSK